MNEHNSKIYSQINEYRKWTKFYVDRVQKGINESLLTCHILETYFMGFWALLQNIPVVLANKVKHFTACTELRRGNLKKQQSPVIFRLSSRKLG